MDRDVNQDQTRQIAGNILIFLPGLVMGASAIAKFAHVPAVVHPMDACGFPDAKLTLVATLELLSAALFLLPRTRSFGLLLLSAFLGGAICTHVQLGEYGAVGPPSILLSLAWIGVALRHPQVLWSLHFRPVGPNQRVESKRESLVSRSA